MDPVSPEPDQGLEELRRVRAELRGSMGALESALAAPAPGRVTAWAERVQAALVALSADLHVHVEVTESERGLHGAVLAVAPRLSHAVTRLSREHAGLRDRVDGLLQGLSGPVSDEAVTGIRARGTVLLGLLARHRQRGADLVFEAYQADVGGEA